MRKHTIHERKPATLFSTGKSNVDSFLVVVLQ